MVDILESQPEERVCDPCCGSGGFLVKTFEHVQRTIKKDMQEPHKNIRIQSFANHNLYGIDINAIITKTAKLNMILHGGTHHNIYLQDGLLDIHEIQSGTVDVVFSDPPFGARIKDPNILDRYKLSYRKRNVSTEILFMERCLCLLKPGGRMGIILPEGVLSSPNFQDVREYVQGKARILLITSIPPEAFMAFGTGIKANVVFFKKFTEEEITQYQQMQRRFDYEIPVAEVEKVGIDARGKTCENQLEALAQKYSAYRKAYALWETPNKSSQQKTFMPQEEKTVQIAKEPGTPYETKNDIQSLLQKPLPPLQFVSLKNLSDWNVTHLLKNESIFTTKYDLVKIGGVLTKNTTTIFLEDNTPYKRITVKRYNEGVVLRDIIPGKQIKTRRHYLVRAGQFILSKIDARYGALGIIPEELDGAIVTADFPTYTIDACKIHPLFFVSILTTSQFLELCQALSYGATARQRIDERAFLNIKIPLPPSDIQNTFVKNLSQAEDLEKQAKLLRKQTKKELEKDLFL